MSKIRNFLTEFDDYELAYFAKFKLSTYLPKTQTEIKNYLTERLINQPKIDRLISEHPKLKLNDKKERCPRCYSDKIRKEKVVWMDTSDGFDAEIGVLDGLDGKATIKDEAECNVCGYWLKDPNKEKKRTFWTGIAEYLVRIFLKRN